ncbi:MAG TPA: glycosyltransferase family 2 protein [Tepidisphaeraceae bacterium]|nr:glycosyltransferase family 2 protein [Tepidisphaeraceae bacterium]
MLITAYVPCHNNESTINEVLSSLRQQTRPADQFLFIDDRCTDQSPLAARRHGFQILQMPGKHGLGAGRNCALAHADGDVLLGVDADVAVDANYLGWTDGATSGLPSSGSAIANSAWAIWPIRRCGCSR